MEDVAIRVAILCFSPFCLTNGVFTAPIINIAFLLQNRLRPKFLSTFAAKYFCLSKIQFGINKNVHTRCVWILYVQHKARY